MGEAVYDHDGFVMGMIDACGFDDEMWLGRKADMMCSAGRAVGAATGPARWEPWLLFDDATLAFGLRSLACAAGRDLARLHQLADV